MRDFSFNDVGEQFYDACYRNDYNEVKRLLDSGISPNETNAQEDPVLYAALDDDHTEILKLLIERGADPNLESHFRHHPPLVAVAILGFKEAAKILLENGADAHYCDRLIGYTPISKAIEFGHEDMAELIKSYL